MIAAIHQPQYLPWLGYFEKIYRSDVFILLDDVQFKKNDWQNRNKIRTPQGWQWLTVPVIHDFGQKIREVRINNAVNWRKAHLTALKLNYSKAPFYGDYIGLFESVYAQEWEYLVDINIFFIKKIMNILGIAPKIIRASDYGVTEDSTQRLVELCKIVKADTYLAGVDGNKYMDLSLFKECNVKIVTQDFKHPFYAQLWQKKDNQNFLPQMSVIDLLFNCGEKAWKYYRKVKYENID